jgi:multiple sugar transport system ATP-binding protein
MSSVHLRNLRKVFADSTVGLHDFSLTIEDQEFLTFLGPSGCGKTTTLRMIAGLEHPTSGTIHFDSRRVDTLGPADRNIAMVFQSYALYPHMTVRGNLEYPLKKRRVPADERARRIATTAEMLKIGPLLERRPKQLSGGQQQRVALGRAMVRDSDVFLFDEPLSNLDAELRTHMRGELIQLHRRLGKTMIYVTHDQLEAMTMSTRIAVLSQGRLQQVGTPDEIYYKPANRFVAAFVGSPAMNFLEGTLTQEGATPAFVTPGLTVKLDRAAIQGGAVVAGLRPEDVILGEFGIPARIEIVERTGHEALIWMSTDSATRLVGRTPADTMLRMGEIVHVSCRPDRLHIFAADTGQRLAVAAAQN